MNADPAHRKTGSRDRCLIDPRVSASFRTLAFEDRAVLFKEVALSAIRQVSIRRLLRRLGLRADQPRDPLPPAGPPAFPCDVLVFPVVDWFDRFQRPQHLSLELAKMGARVFYFANRFVPSLTIYEPDLHEVGRNVFWTKLPGSFH